MFVSTALGLVVRVIISTLGQDAGPKPFFFLHLSRKRLHVALAARIFRIQIGDIGGEFRDKASSHLRTERGIQDCLY